MNIQSRARIAAVLCVVAFPAYAADQPEDETVVVTSTPLRESPLETTQPTSVLSGEELVRLRTQSLGETLAAQPGVSATYFGPQASRPVIRGIGGERVQVYEDGGEALDVSALSNDHSVTIDPLLARSIEVVRGPATLLYGNGASAGLVNVITDRIPEQRVQRPFAGALELRGDTAMQERAGAAHFDGGAGEWAWHLDAHKRDTDDVSIPGFALSKQLRAQLAGEGEDFNPMSDRLDNTGSETFGGAAGGSWIGNKGFAGLSVSRFDTDYGIPNSAGEEGAHIDLKQTRYDFNAAMTDLGPMITTARLRASYNDYTHGEVEQSGEVGTLFQQDGLDARLSLDHAPLAGWRGTFGMQVKQVDLSVQGEEALLPPSKTHNIGYFVYEERPLGPVTIELGARLEQQKINVDVPDVDDYDKSAFSGSAGVLWKMTANYALALNLTSTQRHPTASELHANGPHLAAQRFEVGDPDLRRERATSIDLGLRKTAGAWQGSLTAFRTNYSRYTFVALTGVFQPGEEPGEELPVAQYQQADAIFTGFEAKVELPRVEISAGVIFSHVLADYVQAKLKDGGDLPQIPPLRVGFEVGLERDQFSTSISATRCDSQDRLGPNELPTDGYTMVDVGLSYRLAQVGRQTLLFLRGSNLLDEDARRHSSPLKDFVPLPGRSLGAGIRLEF